jgi:hypothetical protein
MPVQLHSLLLLSDPKAPFLQPLQWRIVLDVTPPVPQEDIDIVFVWLVDASNPSSDVIMDELSITPPLPGLNSFDVECSPPRWKSIPEEYLIGNTGMTIEFLYRRKRFLFVSFQVEVSHISGAIPERIQIKEIERVVKTETRIVTSKFHPDLDTDKAAEVDHRSKSGSRSSSKSSTDSESDEA